MHNIWYQIWVELASSWSRGEGAVRNWQLCLAMNWKVQYIFSNLRIMDDFLQFFALFILFLELTCSLMYSCIRGLQFLKMCAEFDSYLKVTSKQTRESLSLPLACPEGWVVEGAAKKGKVYTTSVKKMVLVATVKRFEERNMSIFNIKYKPKNPALLKFRLFLFFIIQFSQVIFLWETFISVVWPSN